MPKFQIGDRVIRGQDGGAVVISIDSTSPDCIYYELSYDEGGGGWWPETPLQSSTNGGDGL